MLSGKAKDDFIKWHVLNESKKILIEQIENWYYSEIVEWLDSIGIYIHVKRFTHGLEFKEWYFIITDYRGVHFNNHVSKESRILNDSRKEILNLAIKKANEIYNSRS